MKTRFFVLLLACVAAAALTGSVVAQETTPKGTATTATEISESTDSGPPEVGTIASNASTRSAPASEGTATTATEIPESTDSGSTEAGTPEFTPEPSYQFDNSSRAAPSTANVTAVATLDNRSVVTGYRMRDGVMEIDVLVERRTRLSATERTKREGAYEVRFEEWTLQPGNHTLTFETMSNESASLMMYSRRGIENGRAVELRIEDESDGFVSGLDRSDPYVVGITIALLLGLMFLGEAVRRKFALGEGGERLV